MEKKFDSNSKAVKLNTGQLQHSKSALLFLRLQLELSVMMNSFVRDHFKASWAARNENPSSEAGW